MLTKLKFARSCRVRLRSFVLFCACDYYSVIGVGVAVFPDLVDLTLDHVSESTVAHLCTLCPLRLERLELVLDLGFEHGFEGTFLELMRSLGKMFAQLHRLVRFCVTLPSPYYNTDPTEFPHNLVVQKVPVVWQFPALEQIRFYGHEGGDRIMPVFDLPIVKAPKLLEYHINDTICLDTVVTSCLHSPNLNTLSLGVWREDGWDELESDNEHEEGEQTIDDVSDLDPSIDENADVSGALIRLKNAVDAGVLLSLEEVLIQWPWGGKEIRFVLKQEQESESEEAPSPKPKQKRGKASKAKGKTSKPKSKSKTSNKDNKASKDKGKGTGKRKSKR